MGLELDRQLGGQLPLSLLSARAPSLGVGVVFHSPPEKGDLVVEAPSLGVDGSAVALRLLNVGCVLGIVGPQGRIQGVHQVTKCRAGRTHKRGRILWALALWGDRPRGPSDAQTRAQTPGLSWGPVSRGRAWGVTGRGAGGGARGVTGRPRAPETPGGSGKGGSLLKGGPALLSFASLYLESPGSCLV